MLGVSAWIGSVAQSKNLAGETRWVDSVFNSLSADERLAQLYMLPAYSNKGAKAENEVLEQVKTLQPGGLIFFQGTPVKQAELTNAYQKVAKLPMLIAGDYEWGLAMRLDGVPKYPWQMTLGALRNDKLVTELAAIMAKEFKRIGVNVSFSPSLDVNNNPKNPIIGSRSFGDSRENVARLGAAFAKGLEENGVLACGKHFPGHGDTDKDSHKALPVIPFSRERLDSLEVYPFRKMAKSIGSVMVAHLFIPAFDSTPNLPSSLSHNIITKLLREELGFEGLVFTDAMNMKGLSSGYGKGVADVRALKAGVDILLMPGDMALGMEKIKEALSLGELQQADLDEKCRRVLRAKYRVGLNKYKPVDLKNIEKDLFSTESNLINRKIAREAVTVLTNEQDILPLKGIERNKLAVLTLGEDSGETFANTLNLYAPVEKFSLPEGFTDADASKMLERLKGYDPVIISIHKSDKNPWKSFKITDAEKSLVTQASQRHKVILNVLASPYSLLGFPKVSSVSALVLSYQNNPFFAEQSAQVIFGAADAKGMLPVTLSSALPAGYGLFTQGNVRLGYVVPEELGIDSRKLVKVREIAEEGIKIGAYPGCVVLAAKDGKVFYNEAFGKHTYTGNQPVKNSDIFDIASISKITSTLPAVMQMYDAGALDLKGRYGKYVTLVEGTNKENLKIEDILTHQAGLTPWIPFYLKTLNTQKQLDTTFYSTTPVEGKKTQVADNMYIMDSYRDSMFIKMFASTPKNVGKYVYSDLSFYFLQMLVERWADIGLDVYAQKNFYTPLGATTLGFNPMKRFPRERILPTENDTVWRKQLIHGYVHDQGAAMMGGVAGHAGVFSNANDLAKIMQMYLNKGTYGGERYIEEKTVEEFTKCRFCINGNRRGLGFDRPEVSGKGTPCDCVSLLSYGHTGFTGTMAWMDPENGLLYIFLSNRVYPDAENRLLMSKDIRGRIQQVFYDAIGK